MKTDTLTTIFGGGAALFGYLATIVPPNYKPWCAGIAGCCGALFAYFTKGISKP